MLPDRVSNPGPLTYESGALPIALRGPSRFVWDRKSLYHRSSDPANTKRYKNVLGTSTMFCGRSNDVVVTLFISRGGYLVQGNESITRTS